MPRQALKERMPVMNDITAKFLSGVPTELTEGGPETMALRDILEKEGTLFPGTVYETDLSGSVYWSPDRKVAVFLPTPPMR